MENSQKKKVKTLRFEIDQIRIEELSSEKECLKQALKTTVKKKEEIFKLLIEYKKICEEEINKNKELIQEIEKLRREIEKSTDQLKQKELMIMKLSEKNDKIRDFQGKFTDFYPKNLNSVFSSLFSKLKGNCLLLKIFNDKVGSDFSILEKYTSDILLEKLALFIEETVPLVNSHKKNFSAGVPSTNPLFSSVKHKITIKQPPKPLSKISEDLEIAINNSKELIKTFSDKIENGCISTRSNHSSGTKTLKPKIRVYRRQKSLLNIEKNEFLI